MLALMLVLAAPIPPQEARATLQSCAMEGERWVCRYQLPEIEIVPVGAAPNSNTHPSPQQPPASITVPAVVADPPPDAGALTEREARLVTRCAEAGWFSLCTGPERREARALREKAAAYDALRLDVTRLLAEDRCEEAVRRALAGGNLALATQARTFCATRPVQGDGG